MKQIVSTLVALLTMGVTALNSTSLADDQTKTATPQPATVPAFPGAEGYGAKTSGGRGGKVIAVTNLNASGPGSLQAACDAEAPRIVEFKVAGTIDGDLRIRHDHITSKPWPAMAINQQTAEEAYQAVLKRAGCSLPARDAIDARIIEEVRTGTATKGQNGFVLNQEEAGGWIEMKSGPVPADTDNDGMPDEWEKKYGLDPNDASDNSSDKDADGYTNVEEYLNGTDPTEFADYAKPENNINTLEKSHGK